MEVPPGFVMLRPPQVVPSDMVFTKINKLEPFMKGINVTCMVIEKVDVTWTKDNHAVHVLRVADETGSILFALYDQPGSDAKPGDILRITSGFVILFKKHMRLACRNGSVVRTGRVCMSFKKEPDMSAGVFDD